MSTLANLASDFRKEVARTFREAIQERFSSDAEAALDLGISRQRLHKYLRGSATPQADLLLFAVKRWNLTIRCDGGEFCRVPVERINLPPLVEQLRLFEDAGLERKRPASEAGPTSISRQVATTIIPKERRS